jgi:hypothetical protein
MPPIVAERPANSRLLQFGVPSLRSRFPNMRTESGESLWLTPRRFPFLGDACRRPGSIMDCVVRTSVDFAVRRARTTVKRNNLRGRGAIPRKSGAPTFNIYPHWVALPEENCVGQNFHKLRRFCEDRKLSLSRYADIVARK